MNKIEGKYDISENGCWTWNRYKVLAGYGTITINRKPVYAHRYSYTVFKGKIPSGMVVRHKCDTPSCVNPDHLQLGTQKQNVNDISLRGRRNDPQGENNYASKFSDFEVEAARVMYEKYGMPQHRIAIAFGISRTNLNQILKYKKRKTCRVNAPFRENILRALSY